MRTSWLVLSLSCLMFGCAAPPGGQPSSVSGPASTSTPSAANALPRPLAPAPVVTGGDSAPVVAPPALASSSATTPPAVPEPVTAGPAHSRQEYLYRTAKLRARLRRPQVKEPPAAVPGDPAKEKAPTPIALGGPKRLLYSGAAERAPKDLLSRPDVLCEISPDGNVRFFGP